MWNIVRDKKNNFEVIPVGWALTNSFGEQVIWWPKKNLKEKRMDPSTVPNTTDGSWFPGNDKVIERNFASFIEADARLDVILNQVSSSEHEEDDPRNTRSSVHIPKNHITVPKFNLPPNKLLASPATNSIGSDTIQFSYALPSATPISVTVPSTVQTQSTVEPNQCDVLLSTSTSSSFPAHSSSVVSFTASEDSNQTQLSNTNQSVDLDGVSYDVLCDTNSKELFIVRNNELVSLTERGYTLTEHDTDIAGEQNRGNRGGTENYDEIKNFMQSILSEIVTLKRGMEILMSKSAPNDSSGQAGCSECSHCHPELLDEAKTLPFEKIKDEKSLSDLEDKLDTDETFKKNFTNFCHNIIGTKRTEGELQVCNKLNSHYNFLQL